uniref:Ig-like domain-containing protein n=1 Tax=Anabas testudineus TaxID=64144 RepID=A0A3Q1JHL7_ANATE
MSSVMRVLSSLDLIFLWMLTVSRGDTDVSCVLMENCILPCSFKTGAEVVIHWTDTFPVHSYYHDQDQLSQQDQHFKARTSLFKDQISRGNASLLLTGVKVQDQGRYRCFTSTVTENNETFINLEVDAPVNKVDIHQVENSITCSSEGIYPEPELTWSTNPPSNMTLNTPTRVQQTEQQLYSISSSLILSDPGTDVVYSCTISTHRNKRRTTFRQLASINGSSSGTTISCTTSNSPLMALIWRFNHTQIILNQTNDGRTVSEQWRQHVKSVSESGSLMLQNLSSNQEGTYTCELRNAEETFITNTFLRIEEGNSTLGVVVAVVAAGLLVVAVAALLVLYLKKK